jgi:hypothetical protein
MTESTNSSLMELRALVARLCDGELDPQGYGRIEELVRGNPAARQLYIDYLLLQGELHWAGGQSSAPAPGAVRAEYAASASIDVEPARPIARQRRRWPLVGVAVAAGLLVAAVWLFRGGNSQRAATSVAPPARLAAVAELRSGANCVWGGASATMTDGMKLFAGQDLELTDGVARFAFAKGATVLVESPAKFELISATSLRLLKGNVAVRANGPAKEFVVLSRDAAIVDRGTSFAVHCDDDSATEVEVVEGAVEVFPRRDPDQGNVLEMGTNVRIGQQGKGIALVAARPEEYPFTKLIEELWRDIRTAPSDAAAAPAGDTIEADFGDDKPGSVDTFYAAAPGLGWLTPWVASGNPTGKILRDETGFGEDNPYLSVRFKRSYERAIAREYGPRAGFDPSEPHVITWRWRLDGNFDQFGDSFRDRVTFCGNPYFRRSSWPTNSWLIGVAGADEVSSTRTGASTEWLKRKHRSSSDDDASTDGPRHVFAKNWYLFDNKSGGLSGAVFDRRNMIDTGLKLKTGVIYHFAIAVYPQQARYDAAIRDDEKTFVHTGLSFRSRESAPANVIHFALNVSRANDDLSYSLDSIRIRPIKSGGVREQLEYNEEEDSSKSN